MVLIEPFLEGFFQKKNTILSGLIRAHPEGRFALDRARRPR